MLKKCLYCGKDFVIKPHNPAGKYCSGICRSRAYYQTHKEEGKAYTRQYYAQHKVEILAKLKTPEERAKTMGRYNKFYSIHENREKKKNYMKKYQQKPEVKEHRRLKQIEWRKENERVYKENAKKYYAIPEVHQRYMALSRKFRHTPKGRASARYYNERRRIMKLGITEDYTKEQFLKLVNLTEGFCPMCKKPFSIGFFSLNELTIDHNPPVSKAPKGFIYRIENISPLCRSCNSKKGNR